MSSNFNFEAVRKFYQDPFLAKINNIAKRLAIQEVQNITIETDDLVGLGDFDRSKVRYDDRINFHKIWSFYNPYITFDGTDDYLDLGARTSLWSRTLTNFSYSMWVNPSLLTGNAYRSPFGVAEAGDASISLYFTNIAPFSGYVIGADVTSDDYAANAAGRYSTNLCQNLGQWYHIVFTYSQSGTSAAVLKLYVNGILQSNVNDWNDSMNEPLDISASTKALIGRFITTQSSDSFNGSVQDFRWWNTTITDTDAMNVYLNNIYAPVPSYWILMNDGPNSPVDTINGFTTTFVNGSSYRLIPNPLCCFEPDFDKFALDLRFDSFAGRLWDYSGMQNFANNPADDGAAEIFGEPCPTSGVFVPWFGGEKRSLASKIDQSEGIYYVMYDQEDNLNEFEAGEEITRTKLRMTGKTIGVSWIFRLNFKTLNRSNGWNQCLVEHYDDGSNRYAIRVQDDGQIKWIVTRAGTDYKIRTNSASISANQDLELGFSYAVSGNVSKIYINGLPATTVASSEGFHGFNFTDTYFLANVPDTTQVPDEAFCDLNYIQVARLYDEKVLTDQQFLNHYLNKISISNIPYGQALMTDGSVLGAGDPSFTSLSFTDTSFTTGN